MKFNVWKRAAVLALATSALISPAVGSVRAARVSQSVLILMYHVIDRPTTDGATHRFTHPDLTTLDAGRLQHEVAGSRAWIRAVFHVPCVFFAYPSGRFDETVVAAVRAAGFRGAVTTIFGTATPGQDRYRLERIRVDGGAGLSGLAATLGR